MKRRAKSKTRLPAFVARTRVRKEGERQAFCTHLPSSVVQPTNQRSTGMRHFLECACVAVRIAANQDCFIPGWLHAMQGARRRLSPSFFFIRVLASEFVHCTSCMHHAWLWFWAVTLTAWWVMQDQNWEECTITFVILGNVVVFSVPLYWICYEICSAYDYGVCHILCGHSLGLELTNDLTGLPLQTQCSESVRQD